MKCCKCGKEATTTISSTDLTVKSIHVCYDCHDKVKLDLLVSIWNNNQDWFNEVYLK